MYKKVLRPLLFFLDAERAHQVAQLGLKVMAIPPFSRIFKALYSTPSLPRLSQTLWGLPFKVPLGPAAGFDKNASVLRATPLLGFGFMEIGGITPLAQPGNPRPRIFRLKEDFAVLNKVGFPNSGALAIAKKLMFHKRPWPIPLGIQIVKQKDTPNENAIVDYLKCFSLLFEYGDFFVVNVSSPNTPHLRKLQSPEFLSELIAKLQEENAHLAQVHNQRKKPLLIKLAPDFEDEDFDVIIRTLVAARIDGLILTNTTLKRDHLSVQISSDGGISGKPLKAQSTYLIKRAFKITKGQIPIIGVGGIFTAQDAYEKIKAGASLLQVYTGLVYEGPAMVSKIHMQLDEMLKADGFSSITQAIGSA